MDQSIPSQSKLDDSKPRSKYMATLYHVDKPAESEYPFQRYDNRGSVTLRVYPDGLVNIERYRWYGVNGPKRGNYSNLALITAEQDIWAWLMEWELVELMPIGPEDSEYFATDKLTGGSTDA